MLINHLIFNFANLIEATDCIEEKYSLKRPLVYVGFKSHIVICPYKIH